MKRHSLTRQLITWLVALLSFFELSFAGSITSAFAKVKVEHLQPGRTYRASKFYQRIIVVNATDDPCKMTMEIVRPRPEDLDPGFETIPDVTWATLEKDQFDVPAWERAESDLFLTVPAGKEHLGKKYQVHVWTKAVGGGNIGVGLMHKLLFTVADAIDPNAGKEPSEVFKFKIDPFELHVMGIKFGRPIDLYEQSGKALVLKNPNKKKFKYRLEVIRPEAAPILNLKEFEMAPSPEWLSVGEHEFFVDAGSEYRVPLSIHMPRNPNYRNKKYLFLVRATHLDGEIPFSVISRVYVTTGERLLE